MNATRELVNGVEAPGLRLAQPGEAQADDLQPLVLDHVDDAADAALGDGVGLDDSKGALGGHVVIPRLGRLD
jgi:hypothetical protein